MAVRRSAEPAWVRRLVIATGLVMSVGIGVILIINSWRILSGKATDADLIQITESEDVESEEGEPADEAKNRLGDK